MSAGLAEAFSAPAPEATEACAARTGVERAIDYMLTNLSEPLTIVEVASVSGLSPSHFARRFRSATGAPPHQYLMSMRVERAKGMLARREPIAEVAVACGFSHQEHLTRIFRRLTGLTPGGFRRVAQSHAGVRPARRAGAAILERI